MIPHLIFLDFLLTLAVTTEANPYVIIATQHDLSDPFKEQANNYRLNNDIVPTKYDIELTVSRDFTETKTFTGIVIITIKLKSGVSNTSNEIRLNSKNITIDTVQEVKLYQKGNGTNLLNNKVKPVPDEQFETLSLKLKDGEKLFSENVYLIRIKYYGNFQSTPDGFYLSSYRNSNNETEWIAATNLHPTHARKVFPCFDEPSFKAAFVITILHPKEYSVLSNSEIRVIINKTENNMIKTTFKETPIISSCAVALTLSKFDRLSSSNDVVSVNTMWSQKKSILSANYSYEIGPSIIKELNNLTGIVYSEISSKLDQISIPDWTSDAKGNLALATYKESTSLWHPTESTFKHKRKVALNTARALSYNWFGSLVSIDWWSFSWLNEGLACYISYHVTSKIENEWKMEHHFIVEQHQHALANDIVTAGESLSSNQEDVYTATHISNKFNAITYSKGGVIFRMIEHFMGSQYFISGIREYLQQNLFNNTKPEHLWEALRNNLKPETSLPSTLDNIMKTWVEQGGFPVVTVKTKEKNVELSQEMYLLGKTKQKENTNKWYIPISYTTSDKKDFYDITPKLWMKPEDTVNKIEDVIKHDTSWIIVNIQNSAYIRVNYEKENWEYLENALKTSSFDKIHVLSRVQIIDDIMNLARAGFVPYKTALDVTSYLQNETELIAWTSAFEAFEYVLIRLYEDSKAVNLFRQYLLKLMHKFYLSSISLVNNLEETNVHTKEFAYNWACQLGNSDCINEAIKLFNSYINLDERIEPTLRYTVYCNALRYSTDAKHWLFLRNQLREMQIPSQTEVIVNALGCTRNTTLLENFLYESINSESDIQKQDRKYVLEAAILGNQENVDMVFNFLKNNLDKVIEYYGGSRSLSSTIVSLAKRLNQEKQIDEFKQFIYINEAKLVGIDHTLGVALKFCEDSLYWKKEHKSTVLDYLCDKMETDGDYNSSQTILSHVVIIPLSFFIVLLIS